MVKLKNANLTYMIYYYANFYLLANERCLIFNCDTMHHTVVWCVRYASDFNYFSHFLSAENKDNVSGQYIIEERVYIFS